ncbi:MAG: helix-turn-helix domain-containing protein [Chloroflexi bacterium AL-W]|nr:helix-turn-helix domain-containing protein [Chloroflexi bacterium AL-N1]NOK65211.1 helix-turn-helix domain-containing protein [Chloroflexi bacterium AL-N10]NOK72524.1 helix-turn-helix domain-containing protein [Chloroflexi bacterium AL-N5]NOK79390.1 helix-turn-helix domain-containing protein [Chloroflexi bacterium AL-W]NOK87306.1 helix-turn-helix domain-containing protein [Chloroflexi bacterium AL-N15]
MKEILSISHPFVGMLRLKEIPRLDRFHRHDELECNLIVRGSGAYLIDEQRVDLQPNSILWLFPEQEHLMLDQTDDFKIWILVMKPDYLVQLCVDEITQTLLERKPTGSFLRHVSQPQFDQLLALCQTVADTQEKSAYYNAGLSYLLMAAWSAFQEGSVVPINAPIHPAIERIVRYIHTEQSPDDLETIAALVGLTPETVSRLFKSQMGISLTAFRNRCRVDRFLDLYDHGHALTMLEAATMAGFGSYAQFYRVFIQVMKITPAVYRRQLVMQ